MESGRIRRPVQDAFFFGADGLRIDEANWYQRAARPAFPSWKGMREAEKAETDARG